MKSLPSLLAAAGLLFTTAATLPAQDAPPGAPVPKGQAAEPAAVTPQGKVVIKRRGEEHPPMEKVAFLGVDASPVSGDLAAQLSLPEYTGLVVQNVAPGSPADGVLKPHDVLTKLDDQQLIDWRQFVVLVRNHHAGDQVTLSYVREGKPATGTAKLSEQEEPKLQAMDLRFGPMVGEVQQMGRVYSEELMKKLRQAEEQVREESRRMQEQSQRMKEQQIRAAGRADSLLKGNGTLVLTNESGRSVELSVKDGKKTLTVTGPDQKQIFSGPVDTSEQRKALAPEVAQDLARIEGMRGIHLETNVHISTPVPPAPPAPPQAAI